MTTDNLFRTAATGQITVKTVAPVNAGSEGECYVAEGLVFNVKAARR